MGAAPTGRRDAFTLEEAAAIIVMAQGRQDARVTGGAVSELVDRRILLAAVVSFQNGQRALTAAGLKLASAALGQSRSRMDEAMERYWRLMQEIESDPDTQRGEPVIRGTRVLAYTIAAISEQGSPVDEILRHYPTITREQVEAARIFARAHPRRERPRLPKSGNSQFKMSLDELRKL